ncbi:MAG: Do family serine endopeptidase [Bacteroidales bacterium]|nr:Do family serine endopeptidase [Bacteroidales bacterium]
MKTSQVMMLFGAMVVVSGLTAAGTYKLMERQTVQELADSYVIQSDGNGQTVQFFPTVSRASVTDNDFTQAAEKTVNAVVGVKSTQMVQTQQYQNMDPFFQFFFGQQGGRQQQPKAREGYGSGVIISSDGYIVTNNHVIANADQLQVTLNDQRQFEATLVGTDPTTDIALLKIDAKDLPTVTFGESDKLKIGEWVLAVGNPFMLTSTVTAGIVSAKDRQLGMGQSQGNQLGIESFIQTDAAVNPGNSGGALVNTAGELVGINTAIYSETGNYAGYSFAVPSSIVSKVVADLRQFGQVQRAVLGIHISNVTADLVEKEDLKVNEGVYVANVIEDGAAAEAGMQKGDVIVSLNQATVKNMGHLQGELVRHNPGEKVQVVVNRNGKEKTLDVTLKNSKGNTEVLTKKGIDALGVTFKNMTAQELQKYGVRKGVLVKSVEQGGAFARAGIQEKFLIVKINDAVVGSDKDIEKVYNQLTTSRDADQDPVMFIVGVYPNGRTAYYAVDLSK